MTRRTRNISNRAGFTIVEVMISIAVLASLTAVTWVSIANMYRTRDVVEARSLRHQQVRVTLDRMSSELASAYIAGPELGGKDIPGEEFQAVNDAEDMALRLQERVEFGMSGRDDRINFTTLAHTRTQPGERSSYHAEIGYFVRPGEREDGRIVDQLVRRQDTTLDDDIERGGIIYVMLPEVEDIEFEYWDPGPVRVGTFEEMAEGRWVDEWDTSRREFAGRLPTRMRIRLVLPPGPFSTRNEVFTTQVELTTTEVLEF
jgi:prepilin-type N-terminal cleavage/methylation domain-containing protein